MIDVRPEVARALADRTGVVALESTLIAHGLPWPANLETATAAEDAVRAEGAVPATIAVCQGRPTLGLTVTEMELLGRQEGVAKASRRDLAFFIARRQTAATTVAATLFLANHVGIRVVATGGIGGVHQRVQETGDVSADLVELARTPAAVVCAGAKSILDIPRTLELLETLGVPVIGYGTDDFPAFYARSSGAAVSGRVDNVTELGALLRAHWKLKGAGVVVALPISEEIALAADEIASAVAEGEASAKRLAIRGPALTPFLLKHLAQATKGRSVQANQALIVANARLAAQIARALGTTSH